MTYLEALQQHNEKIELLKDKANALPDVVTPTGTLQITENGTHDAKEYEFVDVNVPIPDGYIKPSGELEVTENGTHDVTGYASVKVDVPTGGGGGDSDLPAGYSRVDYIQFTGGQTLVDTGIIGNQDTEINVCFTWDDSVQRHVFGCASSGNTASVTSYMNGAWRFGNKYANRTISVKNIPVGGLVNKDIIRVAGAGGTSITGVNDFETVGTLLLGGARDSDGTLPSVGLNGKVLWFYIKQGGELVLKLVPVTDGTVFRFYDMVSKTFFDSITDTPLDGGNL